MIDLLTILLLEPKQTDAIIGRDCAVRSGEGAADARSALECVS
jgi:hypothetical protein